MLMQGPTSGVPSTASAHVPYGVELRVSAEVGCSVDIIYNNMRAVEEDGRIFNESAKYLKVSRSLFARLIADLMFCCCCRTGGCLWTGSVKWATSLN
jgi:hypothetical protein